MRKVHEIHTEITWFSSQHYAQISRSISLGEIIFLILYGLIRSSRVFHFTELSTGALDVEKVRNYLWKTHQANSIFYRIQCLIQWSQSRIEYKVNKENTFLRKS